MSIERNLAIHGNSSTQNNLHERVTHPRVWNGGRWLGAQRHSSRSFVRGALRYRSLPAESANSHDVSTQGGFDPGDGGRFVGRGSVAGGHAVCRHFQACREGLRPRLRTTGGRDDVFSRFVPRTYPYNPHVTARPKTAKIQLRFGVALEMNLETRARNKRREKKWRKRGVGSAVGLVEHSGSRSSAHLVDTSG